MITLARFILRGPSQAALTAATLAILGVLLPPAAWLSAAAIALIVLVKGLEQGTKVMAIAVAGSSVFAWLIFGAPLLALYFILIVWLPVWVAAVILKQTVSLSYSLLLITALTMVETMLLHLMLPEIDAVFRPAMDELVLQLSAQSDGQLTMEQLNEAKEVVLRLLPGLFGSSILFGTMASLFLARWWQAYLYHPGGFGEEFRALRLGRVAATATVVLMLASGLTQIDTLSSLTLVAMTLYLVQGTSLMHALARGYRLNVVWLIVMYALLLIAPQAIMVIAIAGIADAYADFRRRLLATN